MDVKEILTNNLMVRWMKNIDERTEHSKVNSGLESICGSSNLLKKRSLVNRVLEMVYGPDPITDDMYSEVMGVIDQAKAQSNSMVQDISPLQPMSRNTNVGRSIGVPSNIRCPDRPIKKGRPSHSSLQSWEQEQKRNKHNSTDEENPSREKTRLIADVLAS